MSIQDNIQDIPVEIRAEIAKKCDDPRTIASMATAMPDIIPLLVDTGQVHIIDRPIVFKKFYLEITINFAKEYRNDILLVERILKVLKRTFSGVHNIRVLMNSFDVTYMSVCMMWKSVRDMYVGDVIRNIERLYLKQSWYKKNGVTFACKSKFDDEDKDEDDKQDCYALVMMERGEYEGAKIMNGGLDIDSILQKYECE